MPRHPAAHAGGMGDLVVPLPAGERERPPIGSPQPVLRNHPVTEIRAAPA